MYSWSLSKAIATPSLSVLDTVFQRQLPLLRFQYSTQSFKGNCHSFTFRAGRCAGRAGWRGGPPGVRRAAGAAPAPHWHPDGRPQRHPPQAAPHGPRRSQGSHLQVGYREFIVNISSLFTSLIKREFRKNIILLNFWTIISLIISNGNCEVIVLKPLPVSLKVVI